MSVSRLTKGYEKHNNEFISYVADVSLYPEMMGYEYAQADMDCINKLGKLEDLEDEIGCPLEVREKTLDSFYCPKFENDKKLYTYYVYAFNNEELFIRLIYSQYDEYYNGETTVLLKDYGKTWWLEKPKENEDG